MSVAIWGDSIMRGVIYNPLKHKYELLKESAAELFSGRFSVPVKNHSRFGCTAPRAYESMRKVIGKESVPQWTLLEFGGNDCDYNWAEVSSNPKSTHVCNTPPELFEKTLHNLIDAVRASGSNPVAMSLPPIDANRYFGFITSEPAVVASSIRSFLGDKQLIYRRQELYSGIVCKVAAERDVPLVDIRGSFLEKNCLGDYLCIDGIHPNENGQRLIQGVFSKRYQLLVSR